MGLLKLELVPDQAGYSVADGREVVFTNLDGGASRYRKDILNARALVQTQWTLNATEFRYLKSFFKLLTGKGAKGFLMDLYIDRENLTEHECRFIPGTFKLIGQKISEFKVSIQIEAKPVKLTDAEEESERIWATLYGELGETYETLFIPLETDIDQVVTFDLPKAFAGGVVEPDGGWLRTLNPETATMANLFDVVATLAYDINSGSFGAWSTVEPSGGWLRTFNPATISTNEFFDVVATLIEDLPTTVEVYTLVAPVVPVYGFNPNTATLSEALDFFGTTLIDLQASGTIG